MPSSQPTTTQCSTSGTRSEALDGFLGSVVAPPPCTCRNGDATRAEPHERSHTMSTIHYLKKMTVGALLSGGVALAALGMTAGTAAQPLRIRTDNRPLGLRRPHRRVQPMRAHPSRRRLCESQPRQPWSQVRQRLLLRRPLTSAGHTVRPVTGSLVAGRTTFRVTPRGPSGAIPPAQIGASASRCQPAPRHGLRVCAWRRLRCASIERRRALIWPLRRLSVRSPESWLVPRS